MLIPTSFLVCVARNSPSATPTVLSVTFKPKLNNFLQDTPIELARSNLAEVLA
jgi:hypothetical protein